MRGVLIEALKPSSLMACLQRAGHIIVLKLYVLHVPVIVTNIRAIVRFSVPTFVNYKVLNPSFDGAYKDKKEKGYLKQFRKRKIRL